MEDSQKVETPAGAASSQPNEKSDGKISDKIRPKRRMTGLLIQPQQQLKYSFFLFGGGMFVLAAFMIFFLLTLQQTLLSLADTYQFEAEVTSHLSDSVKAAMVIVLVGCGILSITNFALGIIVSHRIFGPVVPIKRLINDLRDGNYSARGRLRKKDEFHDVMESLNSLASSLEEKKKAGKL